jgi:hypothetical protein
MNARRRDSRARKLRGQRHREAAGMSHADQLFRLGERLAFLEARLKRIRAVERAAADFYRPLPLARLPSIQPLLCVLV